MNYIAQNYNSDIEEEKVINNPINDQIELNLKEKMDQMLISPDVDINNLVFQKEIDRKLKFESGHNIPKKVNHVSGNINYHNLNEFTFNEQYYTFHAYGFAQDPTDFSKDNIIGNKERFNDPETAKSVFTGSNKREKNYKKQLKMRRMKYGDPATGEFMGPWAIYEGEEIFKNASGAGELTDEQKEILKQMEERRLKKIEDDKTLEPKSLNVSFLFIYFKYLLILFSFNLHRFFICNKTQIIKVEASSNLFPSLRMLNIQALSRKN